MADLIYSSSKGLEELALQIEQTQGSDADLLDLLKRGKFCTYAMIPENIQSLWQSSTVSTPHIVQASGCWRSVGPSFEEVWRAVSNVAKKGAFFPVLEITPAQVLTVHRCSGLRKQ